jgi:GNAT superfamily N-acetyltransferase
LGNVYVGAYLAFEPDFAFVLEDAEGVCGYTLGALDSRRFYQRYRETWLPPLRAQRPAPQGDRAAWTRDQQLWHLYHQPDIFLPAEEAVHPSHLHIDLLPRAQGRGIGGEMMRVLLGELARHGSPNSDFMSCRVMPTRSISAAGFPPARRGEAEHRPDQRAVDLGSVIPAQY